MIVKCNYCGKEFKITSTRYNESKNKIFHCCREHAKLAKQENKVSYCETITLTCEYCNENFTLKESYYRKQSKRGQTPKYCSNECRHLARRTLDRIKCECAYCGKELIKPDNNYINHYCDSKCRIAHAKELGTVIAICDYCGKEFEINKYAYDRAKTHFCNQNCFDSYRTNKKETYAEVAHYLRTCEQYDKWRTDILIRDNYKCKNCGSKESLHVHHINNLYDICEKYNFDINTIIISKEFLDTDNGITLCTNCHALEHPYIQRDDKGRFISRSKTKPQKS